MFPILITITKTAFFALVFVFSISVIKNRVTEPLFSRLLPSLPAMLLA